MNKEPAVVHVVLAGRIEQVCLISTNLAEAEAEYKACRAKGQQVELLSILVNAGMVMPNDESTAEVSAPTCEVHHVPMVPVEGKRGPFWSCHRRNADGSFCRYRPPKRA